MIGIGLPELIVLLSVSMEGMNLSSISHLWENRNHRYTGAL